jgi:hypothetical protein
MVDFLQTKISRFFLFTLLVYLMSCLNGAAQTNYYYFVRSPQIVNFNMTQKELTYSPFLSIGLGIARKGKFAEIGTFINTQNVSGMYALVEGTIKHKASEDGWTNTILWFGEVSSTFPKGIQKQQMAQTFGICANLNRQFQWFSIGIPLCLGITHSVGNWSLSSRTVFNLAFNIN